MKITLRLKNPQLENSSLYTQFKVNGEKFKFYPNKVVTVKEWSDKKECVLSGHKNSREINQYLKNWKKELERIFEDFQAKKLKLEKEKIQLELDKIFNQEKAEASKDGEVTDFMSFINDYIKNKKGITETSRRILKQGRTNIILAFNLCTKKEIESYMSLPKGEKSKTDFIATKTVPFADINIDWMKKFENYMYNHQYTVKVKGKDEKRHYKQNYIAKQIKLVKQFIDVAVEAKKVEFFMKKSIKCVYEDVDCVYTNWDELQRYLNLNLTDDIAKEITRDKYVLNCYLGLRYSDLNKLKTLYFKKVKINGADRFVYTGMNQKTSNKIQFVLHPTAVKILKKYNFQPPAQTEKDYNENLKLISRAAKLDEVIVYHENRAGKIIELQAPKWQLITSHCGRRSFCTNFYIEGVNIQAIMSISGHKTEKEFMKYVHKDAVIRLDVLANQIDTLVELKVA